MLSRGTQIQLNLFWDDFEWLKISHRDLRNQYTLGDQVEVELKLPACEFVSEIRRLELSEKERKLSRKERSGMRDRGAC